MGGAGGDSGLCAKRRRVSAGADVRSMSTQEPLGRAVQRTLWAEARGLAGLALLRRPRASHARPPAVPEEEAGVNEASEERRPRQPRRGPPPGDCAPRKRWAIPETLRVVPRGPEAGWGGSAFPLSEARARAAVLPCVCNDAARIHMT